MGHGIEPWSERCVLVERGSFASQDQEGCLEGILRFVAIVQDALADAEHHRPMALHQRGKGILVAAGGEAFQELAIAGLGGGARPDPAPQLHED